MFQKILNFFVKDKMKKINDDLYVGPQINTDDISNLVDASFSSHVFRPRKPHGGSLA